MWKVLRIARCRLSEEDERRTLALVKEYNACLELVKRLMDANKGKSVQWFVREAQIQLRTKDPPIFASEEQLEHMLRWVQRRRNRTDIPTDEQQLLDNRRELLNGLAIEFESTDTHIEVMVQRADGHEGRSTVLEYRRRAV